MKTLRLANLGMALATSAVLLSVSSHAAQKTCSVSNAGALQKCIDTGAVAINSVRNDSLFVSVAKATGLGYNQKVIIRSKKNVWLIGDTVGLESARPSISFKDVSPEWLTSVTYDFSGAVLVDSSRFVTLAGLTISGGARTAMEVTYPSGFTGWKGNNALSIRRSYGVRATRCTFKNAWRGVLIRGENLGGASAYPNPQDDIEQVRRNLPTSNSGLYGRHLIEKCRLYDNSWGIVGDRDWDMGSIFRYNEFFDNFVRETATNPDPWNQAGGAFFTDDVAITPYRIHNNSFLNNGVIFGGYYKVGTQHLFYNNLVGRPKRYHKPGFNESHGWYTQTERQTEMLKFFSEHQRANVIEPQDDAFTSGTVDQVSSGWNNFRMFRIKMDRGWNSAARNATSARSNAKDYDANYPNVDTLALTWYVEEGVTASVAQAQGGKVTRIRQNMWVESYRDPSDNTDSKDYGYGFLPKQIKAFVSPTATNRVFRDVSNFGIWWTPTVPFADAASSTRLEGFLKPAATAFTTKRISSGGWPTYSTVGGVASDLGAMSASATGYADNGLPQLELVDTLVELVHGDTVEFPLNAFSWNGLDPAKITKLRVVDSLSKFYRTMPVTDTVQNQSSRRDNGTYGSGSCGSVGGSAGVNSCRTQVRSVLDSMPWPAAATLTSFPWVNDSLNAGGLRSTRYQYAGKIGGGALPASTNYARAEVVMAAEYEGKTIFSNPAVFIYAKPKYNMIVNVLQADCKTQLPMASDGMSKRVMAGEKVCLQIQPDIDTNITLNFKPLFADFSSLMGSDTTQMRIYRVVGKDTVQDTVKPGFDFDFLEPVETLDKDATKEMSTQFRQAGTPGRITMRALFNEVAGTKISDLRYIQGVSPRILVVPNTIYQATIDTVIYQQDTTTPDPMRKGESALRPKDSTNTTEIPRRAATKAKVILHLRDAFGNILADSVDAARARGLKIRISTPESMTLFDSTGTPLAKTDSLFEIPDGARLEFQGVFPAPNTPFGSYLPLVSAVIPPAVKPGETFANDTTWITVPPTGKELAWQDSAGNAMPSFRAVVGHAVPVKVSALLKGVALADFGETLTLTAPAHVRMFASLADTTPISSIKLTAGKSPVFYLRAVDSLRLQDTLQAATTAPGFEAPATLLAGFVYPNPVRVIYTGNCGKPEMVRITFDSALYFRGSAVQPDQIELLFPGQALLSSVKGGPGTEVLSADRKTLDIAWDPATAAVGTTNALSLYNPMVGKLVARTMIAPKDSVVPVLLGVEVFQGYIKDSTGKQVARDSVVARFSSPINVSYNLTGTAFPFDIQRDGAMITATAKLSKDAKLVDAATYAYAFEFLGKETQIVANDTLLLPGSKTRNFFTDAWGNPASNGCKTPGTVITGRFNPRDAWIVDRDGDGNGDTVFVQLQAPLSSYPERILVRWGVAMAETLTVTPQMLQNWGIRVTDASGPGDSLFAIPLPSVLNVTKGIFPTANWTHLRTAGPADTIYFNDGTIKARIRDSIGPVARNALLRFDLQGKGMDTLVVDLSEFVGGTQAGDSANLSFQLKHGDLAYLFGDGSRVLSVKGGIVTLIVPSTGANTIQRGDSLRVTPGSLGGLVQDVTPGKNAAGDLNPWIVVKAGVRPPLHGWFLDTNGDGRVETALLKYSQNPRGTCPTFTFYWPDTTDLRNTKVPVCVLDTTSKDSLLWKVNFTPFDYGVTGSLVERRKALGVQDGVVDDPTTYRFFMYDSVGPVLLDSTWLRDNLNTAQNPDTLRIVPSEQVIAAQIDPTHKARMIVQFKRGKNIVADSTVKVLSLIGCKDASSCYIVIGTGSAYRPVPGDYVRLSVADSIFDSTSSLNRPSINHPFVPIHGSPRPPYISAYFDRDHDGRIDSVALAFTVPPEAGTVIEVGNPTGAPDGVRSFTVTTSEDGFVGFTIEPWGENVTSVNPATIARIINPAGDTSRFVLADSAAPVISSAGLLKSSDRAGKVPDTLIVKASEPVTFDKETLVFTYKPSGSDSSITIRFKVVDVTWDSATGTWRIPVLPMDPIMPVVGDSLRFAPGKSVTDLAGNVTASETKSSIIVELRPRILDPIVGVEKPIFNPGNGGGNSFELLTGEPSSTGGNVTWSPLSPGFVGNKANPADGRAVFTFSSNMPAVVHLYIYDNAGIYLNDYQVKITKEFIESAKRNRLGEAAIGIAWNGTSKDGSLAVNGVYMVRFVVQRELTIYEVNTKGQNSGSVENYIVKVGVKR
ncbi:MAG: hypothetical protein RL318_603 [Fibrobacterota bacterium]|jgi:hypothetical protein